VRTVDELRVSGSSRGERAFQRHPSRRSARIPADRSPSKIPRARVRLTTHRELRRLSLRSPCREAERESSGSVTAIACRRSRPVVGRSASSRSSLFVFRPSPARTRLGAFSASPERSRTTSFDTLVARAAPFGASPAEDRLRPPRVNATSFVDPGCLRLRAVIEGPRPQFPAITFP
jgi:hypothetical protein